MAAVAQMPVEHAPVVADAVDEQLPVRAGAVVDEPPADAGDAVGTPPPAAADGAEAAAAAMPVVHPPSAPAEQKVVTPARFAPSTHWALTLVLDRVFMC